MFQSIFADSLPDASTMDVPFTSGKQVDQSTQLSVRRTDLSVKRTMMALERSLMAWLRTALSLISFGFTIYKFLDALEEKGTIHMRANAPRNLGLFMIVIGMGMLILGIIQYTRAKDMLLGDEQRLLPYSLTVAASIAVLLLGLFMLMNVIYGIGGF